MDSIERSVSPNDRTVDQSIILKEGVLKRRGKLKIWKTRFYQLTPYELIEYNQSIKPSIKQSTNQSNVQSSSFLAPQSITPPVSPTFIQPINQSNKTTKPLNNQFDHQQENRPSNYHTSNQQVNQPTNKPMSRIPIKSIASCLSFNQAKQASNQSNSQPNTQPGDQSVDQSKADQSKVRRLIVRLTDRTELHFSAPTEIDCMQWIASINGAMVLYRSTQSSTNQTSPQSHNQSPTRPRSHSVTVAELSHPTTQSNNQSIKQTNNQPISQPLTSSLDLHRSNSDGPSANITKPPRHPFQPSSQTINQPIDQSFNHEYVTRNLSFSDLSNWSDDPISPTNTSITQPKEHDEQTTSQLNQPSGSSKSANSVNQSIKQINNQSVSQSSERAVPPKALDRVRNQTTVRSDNRSTIVPHKHQLVQHHLGPQNYAHMRHLVEHSRFQPFGQQIYSSNNQSINQSDNQSINHLAFFFLSVIVAFSFAILYSGKTARTYNELQLIDQSIRQQINQSVNQTGPSLNSFVLKTTDQFFDQFIACLLMIFRCFPLLILMGSVVYLVHFTYISSKSDSQTNGQSSNRSLSQSIDQLNNQPIDYMPGIFAVCVGAMSLAWTVKHVSID